MLDWLRRQKYGAMFIALIAVMFAYPLHDFAATRFLFDVLRAIFFVVALWVIFDDRRLRVIAFVVGTPALAAISLHSILGDSRPASAEFFFHALSAIFFGLTVATILRKVYRSPDITLDSIYGAFCGYLLVGIIFGHVYCILELLRPGSFMMSGGRPVPLEPDGRGDYMFIYFSLITITTVGYGDIVPANSSSRSLATIEAVLGQFYIAVLMADLIGKRLSNVVDRHSEDPKA